MDPDYVSQFLHKIAIQEGFLPEAYLIEERQPQQRTHQRRQRPHKYFTAKLRHVTIRGGRTVSTLPLGNTLDLVCVTPATAELHAREVYALRDILPTMLKFHCELHNLTSETTSAANPDTFVRWPSYYGTMNQTDQPDALVLKDVVDADFGLSRDSLLLDVELSRCALIELAKLHAVSFAMRDKRPELLQELRDQMPHGEMPVLLQKAEDPACREQWLHEFNEAIGTLEADETGLVEEMEALRDSYAERLRSCLILAETTEEYQATAVFSHGDFWLPNVGFLFAKFGIVQSLCLTGWNSMQFNVPVVDILHFLFSSVQNDNQQHMFWDLIQTYHESLSSCLVAMGCDPLKLYPRDLLRDQIHDYAHYGLLVAPMLFAKLRKTDEWSYKMRMSSVIRNFIMLGFEV